MSSEIDNIDLEDLVEQPVSESVERERGGWRKFFKWLIISAVSIFLLISVVWAVVGTVLFTPEILTPQISHYAQLGINSNFSVKSIDVSLFKRFPNITLRIDSLRIEQTKDSIDDLLFARECRISVDPMALLQKKVVVNHMSLCDAKIYIYVDSLHGPLKTFNLPDTQEDSDQGDSLSSFDISQYSFHLRRMSIDSLNLVIDDRTRRFYTRIDNFSTNTRMSLSSQVSKLDTKTGFDNIIVWHDGDLLVKKSSMNLDTQLLVDTDSMKLSFRKADIRVNGIDLTSSGTLRQDSLSSNILVDVDASLTTPSLTEFLALVPKSVVNDKDKITTQGAVALDVNIKGEYGEESLPAVSATIMIDNAKAKYASRKLSLESVDCDSFVYLDFNNPKLSYADIKRFKVNTSGIVSIDASGKVTNFIEAPMVDIAVKSDIDFDRFTEVFPLDEAIVCSGHNISNFKANFALADILESNFAKLYIDGEATFTDLSINYDASKLAQDSSATASLYLRAETGKMLFGENIRTENNSKTLRMQVNFSGLGYRAKSGEYLTIKDIELTGGANFDRTTSEINGFGVRGIAKNSNVGIDSLFKANLEESDIVFTVVPERADRKASFTMDIKSDQIKAKEPTFNSNMQLSSVNMQAKAQRGEKPEEWVMEASVGFLDLSLYTDLFPLDIKIPNSSVLIKDSTVHLTNAEMSIGQSEIVATGYITNIIRKLFVEPRISVSGELAIAATMLDISELMEASNASYMMFEELYDSEEESTEVLLAEASVPASDESYSESQVESESENYMAPEMESEGDEQWGDNPPEPDYEAEAEPSAPSPRAEGEPLEQPRNDTDTLRRRNGGVQTNTIFLVPRRTDFVFDLNIAKALFEDAVIENVEGRATIRRGVLSLEKLSLEAIGAEAFGSMIYKNIDSRSSNVVLNMNLSAVDINRIGELMPSINSMFPMLESFEGEVDFALKANTNLVDDAQIDISTLRSAMLFKGRNLVLMDSETFDDLSKTLMFKNKDRNLIDSLEVYATVEQSKVDVLPFTMSIDRYSAIIGGTQVIDPQTFDVDYEYHISIMKSPLPFKAGVDINGNLTDFSFKVTSAKLKKTDFDEQREIYEQHLQSIE